VRRRYYELNIAFGYGGIDVSRTELAVLNWNCFN